MFLFEIFEFYSIFVFYTINECFVMKQFLALLTSLLFCTFPMSATTFVPDGDEGDPEEIDLRNQNDVDVSILGIGGSLFISELD